MNSIAHSNPPAAHIKLGVGFRPELAPWLAGRPESISCLELTAEHFYGPKLSRLSTFRNSMPGSLPDDFPVFVHGLGLSLGTPGPLDQHRVDSFAQVATAAAAEWISEHVAFTRTAETDLGHLNPVPPTREAVKLMSDHARELADRCGKPLLLENITSHVRLQGELTETEFLNELCARADCGLLLDVTNLFVNSRNHAFDPLQWLHEIDPDRIRQLHIVGYSRHDGRYMDDHSQPVQPELLDLTSAIIEYAPQLQAIILERDADFPGADGMAAEIAKLESLCPQSIQ